MQNVNAVGLQRLFQIIIQQVVQLDVNNCLERIEEAVEETKTTVLLGSGF